MYLAPPRLRDADAFLAAARASRQLHGHGCARRTTLAGFREYVTRFGARAQRDPHARDARRACSFAALSDDALVGVFNFSEIVRGSFHSAYLGYYAFAPHAGSGLMAEGLALALDFAFRTLKLHRVEVNVQPRERALARAGGRARDSCAKATRDATCASPAAGAITSATRCWSTTGAAPQADAAMTMRPRAPRRRRRARSVRLSGCAATAAHAREPRPRS